MGCCDDPTEPVKINRTDVARIQEQYGGLLRDLFTGDPEKVMLKQLQGTTAYLRELAALNAHYASVRKQAISLPGRCLLIMRSYVESCEDGLSLLVFPVVYSLVQQPVTLTNNVLVYFPIAALNKFDVACYACTCLLCSRKSILTTLLAKLTLLVAVLVL